MDTISPAVADAHRLLRQDLCDYLDEAEYLSTKLTTWTEADARSARDLIPDLTMIVRGVLLDHKESADGVCPGCNSAWPCSSVSTVHGLIKDPAREFVKIAQRARAAA
jgi:hypothetical protein